MKTHDFLLSKMEDWDYWVHLLNYFRDKLLFICKFSMEPEPGRQYPFSKIGANTWKKCWYIRKLSPISGYSGIGDLQDNGCKGWGNVNLLSINRLYLKLNIIEHAKDMLKAKQVTSIFE